MFTASISLASFISVLVVTGSSGNFTSKVLDAKGKKENPFKGTLTSEF